MKIEFDLLRNAQDSLERALELVAWGDREDDARRLKQAILAISHAIELLLKEKLRRLHPSLIWEKVETYPNLNSRTVTSEAAITRLKNIGNVSFAHHDIELLRSLRATRNAIEHFSWSTTREEANAIVGNSLEFAYFFLKVELDVEYMDYTAHKDGIYAELAAASPDFQKAAERRRNSSSQDESIAPLACSFCRARAVDPTSRGCRLCGHWEPLPQPRRPWPGDDDIPF